MPDPAAVSEFVNEVTIRNFAFATTGVFAVTVVLRRVFGLRHPAGALVTALIVSYALAFADNKIATVVGNVVAVINACLLFLAVVGANETLVEATTPKQVGQGEQQSSQPKAKRALESFFH